MATTKQINQFRHFNRFYTEYLGLFSQSLYDRPVNFTEARILYELDASPGVTAKELMERLKLDKGYLSRLLKQFLRKGLLQETPLKTDGRMKALSLTSEGLELMGLLHQDAAGQAQAVLDTLPPDKKKELLSAMGTIEKILLK